jgi:hypothetical protein
MAQAVGRRPLTAESMVRRRTSPSGVNGGHSGTGTGFAPRTSVFPCQYHSNNTPYQSPSFIKTLIRRTRGRRLRTLIQISAVSGMGALERIAEARVTTVTQDWVHPAAHPHCCSLRLARFTLPPTAKPSQSLPLPLHYRLPLHVAFRKALAP